MIKTRAKKDDYVEPAEAPGEGKRRVPDIADKKPEGVSLPTKYSIKQKIMELFKIKEIDYKKFNEENKWAIRPNKKK